MSPTAVSIRISWLNVSNKVIQINREGLIIEKAALLCLYNQIESEKGKIVCLRDGRDQAGREKWPTGTENNRSRRLNNLNSQRSPVQLALIDKRKKPASAFIGGK